MSCDLFYDLLSFDLRKSIHTLINLRRKWVPLGSRSFFWNRNCSGNFVKFSEVEVWNKIGGSPYSFRSNGNLYIRNNSLNTNKKIRFFLRLHAFNKFQTIGSFSTFLHWELVFIFSREKKLSLILEKREMIVLHNRLRENGDLHHWEAPFCLDARTRRH